MSDNATHFRNRVVRKAAAALRVKHRFVVANSAWTTGTVERMMREVIATAKAMLHEQGRPPSEWTTVLPAVQWVLNTAVRQRLGTSPYCVMLGREPRTAFSALAEEDNEGMALTAVDEE